MKKKKEQKKCLDYGNVRKEKREKMEGEKGRRWVAGRWWISGSDQLFGFLAAVRSGGEQKKWKKKERKKKRKKWKM